jgi:hypothetical protein
MIRKLDNIAAGVIIGIIIPFVFFYFLVFPKYAFLGKLHHGMFMSMFPLLFSRCVFPNALLFFILLWADMAEAAKGLLIITGLITIILLFINFVL